jgi:aminoglycoside-2''-adenylyltransferase
MEEHERPWKPLSVREVAAVFKSAPFFWCIAGGYAIEFFVGKAVRPHNDIDIFVLRRDAQSVRDFLSTWDCWMADPPGRLRVWPVEETLPSHAHDVWCRKDSSDAWRFQLMFDESTGEAWQSRRDPNIMRPISEIAVTGDSGTRFLSPEIQLFYKAKGQRPKDETDFAAALPKLSLAQRVWLASAIRAAYGSGHDWLRLL